MAGALSSPVILRHILRQPTPSASLLTFFHSKSLSVDIQTTPLHFTSFPLLSPRRPLLLSRYLFSSPSLSLSEDSNDAVESCDEVTESENEVFESQKETFSDNLRRVLDASIQATNRKSASRLPNLTVKEKKELASHAHSLGKKLKCQQVGKSGVTDSVARSLIETLEANELLKIKIHDTCPGELDDVVTQLEEVTGSVVVCQIGRTVIFYRPSLTKLKAGEQRKQVPRVLVKKQSASRPLLQNKVQEPTLSARGRRKSSRF